MTNNHRVRIRQNRQFQNCYISQGPRWKIFFLLISNSYEARLWEINPLLSVPIRKGFAPAPARCDSFRICMMLFLYFAFQSIANKCPLVSLLAWKLDCMKFWLLPLFAGLEKRMICWPISSRSPINITSLDLLTHPFDPLTLTYYWPLFYNLFQNQENKIVFNIDC